MKKPYSYKTLMRFLRESNAIEGVYDRTSLIQAHRAWGYLMTIDVITPAAIKEAHRILMLHQPLDHKYIGDWRDVPVWIGGVRRTQPKIVVDSLIRDWCDLTNNCDRNFDAVSLHVQFEQIHPFIDGNGRIGRLLLNWHLVKRNGCPLLIYSADDRHTYYRLFPEYRAKELQRLISLTFGYEKAQDYKKLYKKYQEDDDEEDS